MRERRVQRAGDTERAKGAGGTQAARENRYAMLKRHFGQKYHQVHQYDELIRKLIPRYEDMHRFTLGALRFPANAKIRALDLGIGTGETTQRLFSMFPQCNVVGIDISGRMLSLARQRLARYAGQTKFVPGDFSVTGLGNGYDAALSVLAVHHLPNQEKRRLFRRIAASLKTGAPFVMADIIKFRSEAMSKEMETKWRNHLLKKLGEREGRYWFENYLEEDIPAALEDIMDWMSQSGFKKVKCLWKNLNYAVVCGEKT